ncbi:MAG TPA: DUF302 domain-containing protein [Labilithrix sp.]|nr:DUF302 domain-containing protein [Labilithrix sp.]
MNRTSIAHSYPAVRRELSFAVGYSDFIRALDSLLGRMSIDTVSSLTQDSPEKAREKLSASMGVSSFALFQKIDHGAILKALTGRHVRAVTYVFGNPLIASELVKHEPMIGLYVPPRLFVGELENGGTLAAYDVPSATFRQFGSDAVDSAAARLDAKVEKLVDVAAALAVKAGARKRGAPFTAEAGGRR